MSASTASDAFRSAHAASSTARAWQARDQDSVTTTALSRLTRSRFTAGAAMAGALSRLARADAPLRIGVLTEMGGSHAEDSGRGSVAAKRLAVGDLGRAHPGLPVDLGCADAQTKPDVAAAIACAWLDRDGVGMIIDLPVSNCALAIATVARARNRAAILNSGTPALTGTACSPSHVQWAFDTYALASSTTTRALMAEGGDT